MSALPQLLHLRRATWWGHHHKKIGITFPVLKSGAIDLLKAENLQFRRWPNRKAIMKLGNLSGDSRIPPENVGAAIREGHESHKTVTTVVFAIEGHRDFLEIEVANNDSANDFAKAASQIVDAIEVSEVFLEDHDQPLIGDISLVEQLSQDFIVLHVATPGKCKVTFQFNGPPVEHEFRPSATIKKLTAWAVGPDGLKLEGQPSDFQLKHDGHVLEPDTHLGQVTHGKKEIHLDVVMKVKAQG